MFEAVAKLLLGIRQTLQQTIVTILAVTPTFDARSLQRISRITRTFRGTGEFEDVGMCAISFQSGVAAVRATLEIRTSLTHRVKIGVHRSHDENRDRTIGAELGNHADANGVVLTDEVFQEVRRRLELSPEILGEKRLGGGNMLVYQIGQQTRPRTTITDLGIKPLANEIPSLAVLSFRNMNADPGFEYFGDGIAVDLVEELLRIPRLHVISTMSTFTYKKSSAMATDIGKELGARHVLEGSVRQAGSRVRITAQLTNTQSGEVEWADHYDRSIDDVFAVQDEITKELSQAMDTKFYLGEAARHTHQLIRSSEARSYFYKAWELMNRMNKADNHRANELFNRAIDTEPSSPLPYALLAWLYYVEMERGWADSSSATVDHIKRLVDKALNLGDNSGVGPMLLGYLSLLEHDHETALQTSKSAIELRPSCPVAFSMRAGILNYAGKAGDAVEPAKHALRISPIVQPVYPEMLSLSYYLSGQIEEAIETANRTLKFAPDSVDSRVVLAAALVESGRTQSAEEIGADIVTLDPTFALRRYESTHPFRDKETLERITECLYKAGLTQAPLNESSQYGLGPESRRRGAPQRKR